MAESRCGILCGRCSYREETGCRGCTNIENPFWGNCSVKSCCEGKKLEYCGECEEFPCSTLQEFAYAKQEGDEGVRLDQCKIWNAAQFMKYPWIDEFLMAKKGVEKLPPQWNWIRYAVGGNVPDELLKDLLEKSYFLVLGGFSKKKQREILGGAENGI